ncbi:MAG: ArsR family transcriptional regulator [Thermoplasmatales archaeon]|nr:ArsR family transcriptional regulator [Thermoplasmatales archaeon]
MQAKLINDITDLAWLSKAFDTEVKRNVFNEVFNEWKTMEEIEEKYGKEGKETLKFFEKVKMVETRWIMPEDGKARKEYHAFYNAFHINVMTSIENIKDTFSIVLMDDKKFREIEKRIYERVKEKGELSREIEKEMALSPVQMRCIVKRSKLLEYKGMKIEKVE